MVTTKTKPRRKPVAPAASAPATALVQRLVYYVYVSSEKPGESHTGQFHFDFEPTPRDVAEAASLAEKSPESHPFARPGYADAIARVAASLMPGMFDRGTHSFTRRHSVLGGHVDVGRYGLYVRDDPATA
jgi:hypothetical protein